MADKSLTAGYSAISLAICPFIALSAVQLKNISICSVHAGNDHVRPITASITLSLWARGMAGNTRLARAVNDELYDYIEGVLNPLFRMLTPADLSLYDFALESGQGCHAQAARNWPARSIDYTPTRQLPPPP